MIPPWVRVAVLVSGGGTNLQALLDAFGPPPPAPPLPPPLITVARVVASRAGLGALERARCGGVPAVTLRDPADPVALLAALEEIDLVVLAGYLKLVPAPVVARFLRRMINIHPALLPAFGGPGMYGRRVHEAVLASGVTVTGATVHYVDEQYDRGPIIAQWPVPVRPDDTPDTLAARVVAVEHQLLPAVVRELARRGLPAEPVRLCAEGAGFGSAGEAAVRITQATE
ncbi:MAG: phosphoribosylglycinamide formyltransferase [Gemmatimonadales bacterium]